MWFDVSAAMVCLQSSEIAPALIRMTENNTPQIAEIAEVAAPRAQKPKPAPVARTDGLSPDAVEYLDYLHRHGHSTYGAFATALGWGATRAWKAEARLRMAGSVRYDGLGKAVPVVNGGPL